MRRRLTWPELVGLGALVFAASAFFALAPFPTLSGASEDALVLLRRANAPPRLVADRLAIVAINEATLDSARFFDRPRVLWTPALGELIDKLSEAGATVIGFDLILPATVEQELPGFDLPLRQAFRRAADRRLLVLGEAIAATSVAPHPGQIAAAGAGNIFPLNLPLDPDGVVRSGFAYFVGGSGDPPTPSFSAEIAARDRGPQKTDRMFSIDWSDIPEGLPIYELSDVLACTDKARLQKSFHNRIVLIGTLLEGEDRLSTPLRWINARFSVQSLSSPDVAKPIELHSAGTPGMFIQAAAIATLLSNTHLEPLVPLGRFPLFALLAAASALLAFARTWTEILGLLGLAIAWLAVCCLLALAGLILPLADGMAVMAVAWVGATAFRIVVVERERRFLHEAFGRFLAPVVVEELIASGSLPKLGGEHRTLTVLLTDLANFTPLVAAIPAEAVVAGLNTIFGVIVEEVEARSGFVAQFIGDATVSFFGAPLDDPAHARHAVEASLAIARRLRSIEAQLSEAGGVLVHTRFGINTGDLIVGNIGAARRLNYTAIGDAINMAQRFEQANKEFGSFIAAGEKTVELCAEFPWEGRGLVPLKGATQPMRVYTLSVEAASPSLPQSRDQE